MSITYAHDVGPKNDYFVDLADKAVGQLSANAPPGPSLLYSFPILRYIPSWKWFPGGEFKSFVLESRKMTFKMRDIPIGIVEKQMVCAFHLHAPLSNVICLLYRRREYFPTVLLQIYCSRHEKIIVSFRALLQLVMLVRPISRSIQAESSSFLNNSWV